MHRCLSHEHAHFAATLVVVVDVTTLKMARKPVKIQRKVQQDALGKVNRVNEIMRREQDGLKITDNKHYVRKKV